MKLNDSYYLLAGWVFFIISALFFIAVGIRSKDWLTLLGAIFFLLADIAFLIPFLRNSNFKNHD